MLLHPSFEHIEVSTYVGNISFHVAVLGFFVPPPAIEADVSVAHYRLSQVVQTLFYFVVSIIVLIDRSLGDPVYLYDVRLTPQFRWENNARDRNFDECDPAKDSC